MQVLGHPERRSSRNSGERRRSEEISSAHSAVSFEFHGPLATAATGPMDFKVDVHRKNSSESSGSASGKTKVMKLREENVEAGTSKSGMGPLADGSTDLKTFIDDVMRRSRRREGKNKKRERGKTKTATSESSSTSSDSRSTSGSSHGDRIYKYDDSSGGEGSTCSSSSSSSSVLSKPKDGESKKATGEGTSTENNPQPVEATSVAESSTSIVEDETGQSRTGAKKKRFHSARLQRQVSFYYSLSIPFDLLIAFTTGFARHRRNADGAPVL